MKDKYHPQKLLPHLKYPEYPVMIDFDITNVCNNKCPKCIGIAGRDNTTMKLENVINVLNQTREVGAKGLILSGGGDPTCHPDFDKVMQHAHKIGFDYGINTNGNYISDSVLKEMMNCWTARISLDGSNRGERLITHGVDDYDKVVNNIKRIVDKKEKTNSGIDIIVTYLIGDKTKNGILPVTKMLKDIGVNEVRFRPFFGKKMMNEKDLQKAVLESDKDKNFVVSYPDYRINPKEKRDYTECLMTNFLCSITPDQHVRPCCILKERGYSYGSLEDKSFKDIWKNKYKVTSFKDCEFPCPHDNNNDFLWAIKQMKVTNII